MTDFPSAARVPFPPHTGRPPRRRPHSGTPRPRGRFLHVTRALGLPVLLAVAVTAAAPGVIRVEKGDTLSHIAKRHGISVSELQRINGMGGNTLIFAGQELRVTDSGGSGGGGSGGGGSPASGNRHRIAPGDTLSGIAQHYGVSTSALADANGIPTSATIYAGQSLAVPAGGGPVPAADAGASQATRSAPRTSLSREQVRGLIRDTARRYGVDPSLALAIAHQESGFQQHVVSSANAIGVMQVLPGTVQWMESVVGRDLDAYDVRDNVEAGVALLKVLRSQASVEDTIAAYYQGLRAVRERGWYAETTPYVANVRALQARYS